MDDITQAIIEAAKANANAINADDCTTADELALDDLAGAEARLDTILADLADRLGPDGPDLVERIQDARDVGTCCDDEADHILSARTRHLLARAAAVQTGGDLAHAVSIRTAAWPDVRDTIGSIRDQTSPRPPLHRRAIRLAGRRCDRRG